MTQPLMIWLYGQAVARVQRTRNGRLALNYTDAALNTYELGEPLLSYTIPVSPVRYPNAVVRSFLEGLLPEGDVLRAVADELNLRPSDIYALIGALGQDCAGALVIQPEDDPAPRPPSVHTAEPLKEEGFARLIDNLHAAPLGIDRHVRISLGGAQEKLLLTRMTDGTWGRPVDGTPSTHILKPQILRFGHTVENEAFCMRVAAHAGLVAAEVETVNVLGRPLLVVRRYDRVVHDDGTVERIHQEDFCQALGLPPSRKYEEDSGPTLREVAGIVEAVAPDEDLDAFLRAVTLNAALGNGDAHGKNFSLLHERSGALRLAPLYDLMCTLMYGQDRLAMYVDNVQRIERVTDQRLVNEAISWGMSRQRASAVVGELLDRIPSAVERAALEIRVPDELLNTVQEQLDRIRSA